MKSPQNLPEDVRVLGSETQHQIVCALCAAAVERAKYSSSVSDTGRLKELREALMAEVSAVYGITPVAPKGKKRAAR